MTFLDLEYKKNKITKKANKSQMQLKFTLQGFS